MGGASSAGSGSGSVLRATAVASTSIARTSSRVPPTSIVSPTDTLVRRVELLPVDERAVHRAEVADHELPALAPDEGVAPRELGVAGQVAGAFRRTTELEQLLLDAELRVEGRPDRHDEVDGNGRFRRGVGAGLPVPMRVTEAAIGGGATPSAVLAASTTTLARNALSAASPSPLQ